MPLPQVFVRNDHQCLFAYCRGIPYYVEKDPLLHETYLSIVLNDELIFFHDLVADRVIINNELKMTAYNSIITGIRGMEEEHQRAENCKVDIGFLFMLANQHELLDGRDYSNVPLYVKGEHLIEIMENAGYKPIADYYIIDINLDEMYFIDKDYYEGELVNLLPDCVIDIVGDTANTIHLGSF